MGGRIRIAVAGAGRMGRAVAEATEDDDRLALCGIWSRGDNLDSLDALVRAADVTVDFSLPAGTAEVVAAVRRANKPLVCGVSGLDHVQMAALDSAAESVPVVYDRNMSQGITVLDEAIRHVAARLGPEFESRIEECHHVHKIDAPSGTALKLGATLAAARRIDAGDIVYSSERRGDVAGDHAVIFAAPSEVLSFTHSVTTRAVFAQGALRAAAWVVSRPPGLYGMRDVLFGD